MSKKAKVLTKEEELKRFDELLDSDPKRMTVKDRQFFAKEAQKLLVKSQHDKTGSILSADE